MELKNRQVKIYLLSSSENPTYYRYVGKTIIPLRQRLREHLRCKGGRHLNAWIKLQTAKGNEIRITLIEDNSSTDREIYWISTFRKWGYNLCNLTDGGDGNSPGNKHSPETRRKISESNKGRQAFFKGKKRPEHSKLLKALYQQGILKTGKLSEESINSIREKAILRGKKIYALNRNNEVVYEFSNITEASSYLQLNKAIIHHYCKDRERGKDRSYKGYKFCYDPNIQVKPLHVVYKERAAKAVNTKALDRQLEREKIASIKK